MGNQSSNTETFVVENCILSFPHLFALDNNGKYSCALLIPEAAAQMVYQKAQELAASHFTNGESALPTFRWPVMKASDKQSQTTGQFIYRDNPRLANLYLMSANASEEYPPQVVDQNRQKVMDRGLIYAGCIVAVGIRLFTYNNKGNIGIGVGLSAVMKQGDGESLGGDSVNAEQLFSGVQAQAAAPVGQPMPGGAPMPTQQPAAPFGQPQTAPAPGMPAAPFQGAPTAPAAPVSGMPQPEVPVGQPMPAAPPFPGN